MRVCEGGVFVTGHGCQLPMHGLAQVIAVTTAINMCARGEVSNWNGAGNSVKARGVDQQIGGCSGDYREVRDS